MAQRVMLKWSQARQKDIQDACNDTASWTASDEIIYQHTYSFSSIAAWPVDGCLVCKPTERASVLLGSLQAACNLDVIKEDLGVSVTAPCVRLRCNHMELHRIGKIISVSTM